MQKLKIKWIFILFVCLLLTGCILYRTFYFDPGPVMVLSISSDGNYVISTHQNAVAILWDLKNKSKKIISYHANVYSAYFIKHSDNFIWQDLHDNVHIENFNGEQIHSFHNFPTYGQVMTSDLKHYFASDVNWGIYSGYGKNQKIIKNDYDNGYFIGIQKLLNLTLSNDEHFLLSSGAVFNDDYDKLPLSAGYDAHTAGIIDSEKGNFSLLEGVTLWNIDTGKPLRKFPGNEVKTFATISPDDKYIIGGDEQPLAYVWETKTGKKLFDLDNLYFGHPVNSKNIFGKWDKRGLISIPNDFTDENGYFRAGILSIKFIDKDHYLRFTTDVPYAILYSIQNPQPIKYLKLGTNPFPSVTDYSRDQSIDTAPEANILVMGQDTGNGIIVYKYDPQKQTLNKVWVGKT